MAPLPGARELLGVLSSLSVPYAIATSGTSEVASAALGMLDLPWHVPIVTRDLVQRAKPDPDLFLAAAASLGATPAQSFVVGDSVWDLARRPTSRGLGHRAPVR